MGRTKIICLDTRLRDTMSLVQIGFDGRVGVPHSLPLCAELDGYRALPMVGPDRHQALPEKENLYLTGG